MPRVTVGLPRPAQRVPCALAIGNFDGVHRGHQELLSQVVRTARERGLRPAVLTFEPHPGEFFGAGVARVQTTRDRLAALLDGGAELVFVLRFDAVLAALSPEDFARRILALGLSARHVCVGRNFHFGRDRGGDLAALSELGRPLGFTVHAAPLLTLEGQPVSSSRVRAALSAGDLPLAESLLGRPYVVTGRVIHGRELGRTIGFPTLNLPFLPPGSPSRPAVAGVWAVRVRGLAAGRALPGMASLGTRPTVLSDGRWLLEAHVFDWSGSAYGRLVGVEFVSKLRDERRFAGLPELRAALSADRELARRRLGL